MKILTAFFGACAFIASPAQANISDSDTEFQEVDCNFVLVAQPAHVAESSFAAQDMCVLPMDHLVAIPADLEAAGEVVLACVVEGLMTMQHNIKRLKM